MKKTIFKYKISIHAKQDILMPKGAEILCVREQHGEPCIWAIVNPDAQKEGRVFRIIKTGGEVPYDMGVDLKYIGTFMVESDSFVGHLFEQL